jgi:hypothetical protein
VTSVHKFLQLKINFILDQNVKPFLVIHERVSGHLLIVRDSPTIARAQLLDLSQQLTAPVILIPSKDIISFPSSGTLALRSSLRLQRIANKPSFSELVSKCFYNNNLATPGPGTYVLPSDFGILEHQSDSKRGGTSTMGKRKSQFGGSVMTRMYVNDGVSDFENSFMGRRSS